MKEEVFYKHGRRNSFHKDYTICGKVVGVGGEHDGFDQYEPLTYELHIGVSVCHKDDTFEKKVGTTLAFERATNNPSLRIALQGDRSYMQYKSFVDNFLPTQALYNVFEVDVKLSSN